MFFVDRGTPQWPAVHRLQDSLQVFVEIISPFNEGMLRAVNDYCLSENLSLYDMIYDRIRERVSVEEPNS